MQFNANMATTKQEIDHRSWIKRNMQRGKQCCCNQESHGDWLATEHNSAVANNLKQKYGKHKCGDDDQ